MNGKYNGGLVQIIENSRGIRGISTLFRSYNPCESTSRRIKLPWAMSDVLISTSPPEFGKDTYS